MLPSTPAPEEPHPSWIETTGGPLVLLPQHAIRNWNGSNGDGLDYEAACSVDGYLGVLPWRGYDIIVFGDEPARTTVATEGGTVVVVRWIYAPSESAVMDCLRSRRWGAMVEELAWRPKDEIHAMFDSASGGKTIEESLVLNIPIALYTVRTYEAKGSGLSVLIHSFDVA